MRIQPILAHLGRRVDVPYGRAKAQILLCVSRDLPVKILSERPNSA